MAKSRQKTQQLGFWDPEVSSPDHDSVCLWAYENAEKILRAAFSGVFDRSWTQDEIDLPHLSGEKQWVEAANEFAAQNPRPSPKVIRKTLEYVLQNSFGHNNQYKRIVGYADLLIEAAIPEIQAIYKRNRDSGFAEELEGFKVAPSSRPWLQPRILVEAKSVLPTVGELMRQIQLYRTAFNGRIVVVSPDDSYSKILQEQEVLFIQYST